MPAIIMKNIFIIKPPRSRGRSPAATLEWGMPEALDVTCPCCEALLKVDPETGAVVWADRKKAPPKDFDDLVSRVQSQKSVLDEKFARSVQHTRRSSEILEKKFEEARKRAEADPDGQGPPPVRQRVTALPGRRRPPMMVLYPTIRGDLRMLKRIALAALAVVVAGPVFAQGNPRGEAKAMVAGKAVSIDYGRPSLKGRDMLGQAQIGQAWRMGADAATSLKTDADLAFGAVDRAEGRVHPDRDQGRGRPVAPQRARQGRPLEGRRDPPHPGKLDASVELFTIALKGEKDKGELEMHWGTTALKAAFTGK